MQMMAFGICAHLVRGRAQQQHLGGDAARRRRHRRRLHLRRPEVAVPQHLRTRSTGEGSNMIMSVQNSTAALP
jgi:hypothetical protein